MKTVFSFLRLCVGVSMETGFRYFLFAGLAWLIAYVWLRKRWWHRRVNPEMPERAAMRREIWNSVVTLVIFGVVGAATVWVGKLGYTQMYFRLHAHSMGWFFGSVGVAIILHDAYFYWTHRLMHHPKLYRFFHQTHHRSINPSPWAAYSFAPLEAVVQAGIFPLCVLVMPIHPLAFLIFMIWQLTFNVLGHTGFEFHPKWLMDSWLGKILNTPTNHVMHHEYFRDNYGLYFNYWDRICGTNHERYEERFREVTSRTAAMTTTQSSSNLVT